MDNNVLMAIVVGKKSEEGSFKMYKGIGAFNIIAVNPTKSELEAIVGREIENEPQYLGETEKGEKYVRVVFYAKTDVSASINNGIELLLPISFTLVKAQRVGQSSGKVQIIDKYGRTAWASPEEYASKSIPQYAKGPANISADYRAAYQGEEALVNFLIQWLNIPGPATYKDGVWTTKPNPSDSEVSLDMTALFSGNVEELKGLVSIAAPYIVKGAVGIKTVDGEQGTKQYQTIFNRQFAKNATTNYSKIDAAITEFQNAGGAPNTEFSVLPLHENEVVETAFAKKEDDPLDAAGAPASTPWG